MKASRIAALISVETDSCLGVGMKIPLMLEKPGSFFSSGPSIEYGGAIDDTPPALFGDSTILAVEI